MFNITNIVGQKQQPIFEPSPKTQGSGPFVSYSQNLQKLLWQAFWELHIKDFFTYLCKSKKKIRGLFKIFKNMKRQDYQKPTMDIVKLQQTQTLLAGSGKPSMRNSIDGWGNGGEDNEELTI